MFNNFKQNECLLVQEDDHDTHHIFEDEEEIVQLNFKEKRTSELAIVAMDSVNTTVDDGHLFSDSIPQ